ncbi:MAG: hypothetical protein A2W30_03715 [Ignavibacteria bacterium RBG_16_36_9]|nr:MAG: hypothetical protein A2W30_03715 [Ignavibacteria bacterium RBG_16_36_9]
MQWNQIMSKISPYIVKIETPSGIGTGFLCVYNSDKSLCGVATAYHVVADSDEWEQPIRITHHSSKTTKLFKEPDRFIFRSPKVDSAIVIFPKSDFPFPEELIKLLPSEKPLDIGNEVGWVGFPAIDIYSLCFFSGIISARKETLNAYLIDGVAINGVSGGPVVYSTETECVQIVGIITAYQANRQRGDALPGLSIAQDVSYFHQVIKTINSVDEAKKKKPEIEGKLDEQIHIKTKNG